MRGRILHQDAPALFIPPPDTANDAVTIAATAYRDALYLYGDGLIPWAELVTKHRELRAAIHRRRRP
jgi:hypothetical protein